LVWLNRFWAAVWVLTAAAWGFRIATDHLRSTTRRLIAHWSGGDLSLRSASDGPFLVTHLALLGTSSETQKAVAQLPVPLAIIDSGGAVIPQTTFRRLVWRNLLGQPVPAPPEGAPVRALYSRLKYTNPAGAP
jgi:hypothetical protein